MLPYGDAAGWIPDHTLPATVPLTPEEELNMAAYSKHLRTAFAALVILAALSPAFSVARAGEDGPPVPSPGCVTPVLDAALSLALDLGAGVLAPVL
jgi:hypothetical protein